MGRCYFAKCGLNVEIPQKCGIFACDKHRSAHLKIECECCWEKVLEILQYRKKEIEDSTKEMIQNWNSDDYQSIELLISNEENLILTSVSPDRVREQILEWINLPDRFSATFIGPSAFGYYFIIQIIDKLIFCPRTLEYNED